MFDLDNVLWSGVLSGGAEGEHIGVCVTEERNGFATWLAVASGDREYPFGWERNHFYAKDQAGRNEIIALAVRDFDSLCAKRKAAQ